MKLLLGCGAKKMKGWVGVDINEKLNPHVVDNVVYLKKFSDSYADELKSQFVFEHLCYADALEALRNWFRVLKPGGVVSIELPNLDECYKMVKSNNSEERQLGFFGLFGDSSSVYLMHKSGWSFDTLEKKLLEAGFVEVSSAKPERVNRCTGKYKRDMRLVAVKPN